VATDPRKLRPSELCRLLNSTSLGEVINVRQLKRHRERAGLRVGDARHVDLVRYVAWLMQIRHAPKSASEDAARPATALAEAAEGGAALGSRSNQMEGDGPKLTSKQEAAIAALLTESSYAAAATKAGVGKTTLYRWMQLPSFRAASRQARRELVESAIGRIQAATGQAVETLLAVARQGRRDSDRVRAAIALLHHALRGAGDVDALPSAQETVETGSLDTGDIVQMLSDRLRQLDVAELPTGEKARLTATLADALLRAIGVNVLDKRLEALQAVLLGRKEKE
jgi:transposase-like protein